jgi:replicative DNA helicase
MEDDEVRKLGKVLSSPLSWSEAFLRDPASGQPFKANYLERKILSCDEKRVVVRAHRRGGKSYSMAVLALWSAVVHKFYDVLIACPDDDKVSELFEVINDFVNSTPILSESLQERTKSPHLIKFKNGSTIKGRTTGTSGNKEGRALRGKGANLVLVDEAAYLQDGDFKALTPIILGDKYKSNDGMEVRAVIGSTPAEQKGRFFEWCSDTSGQWFQIHIPITENPDFTEEDIDERRSLSTDMEFTCEYMAEFLEAGFSAFRVKDIERAKVDYGYASKGCARGAVHRAMGVDWDKYQAGVNICIVDLAPGQTKYRLIYREEVGRSEYTLTNSVKRVIALNEAFDPEFIYVDRGYGEHAVEELKLHGKANPSSGLATKVVGFNFNENVTINDPVDGTPIKKQFKSILVNTMLKLLEDGCLEISSRDRLFDKQLRDYKILGVGSNTIRTSRKNEHIIDACGLACYALYSHYQDNLKLAKASVSYSMPMPKVVPSKRTIEMEKDLFRGMRGGMTERSIWYGFSRGALGDITRSSF